MTRSLTEELLYQREEAAARGAQLYDELVQKLAESGAVAQALREGQAFPDFMLASAEGQFVRRDDLLGAGPVVISFYRGAWCNYCSAELFALKAAAAAIKARGARLVAITPEAGGIALRTKFELQLDFEILCDLDNVLALECGLVFPIPDALRQVYLKRGIEFPMIYGNDSWLLPVPATYVLDASGVVATAYVNPDFRYRLDPQDIIAQLAR